MISGQMGRGQWAGGAHGQMETCHLECAWARGPRIEMKVIAVVTPAKAGVHLGKMDSRFRGNDVTFRISVVISQIA